ncbi:MAG: cell envelope integrity protein TolA [Chlorobiaceae bacterium]|nr:cell envelope integrity protein TolA [Chlorobiaceae bacterium]
MSTREELKREQRKFAAWVAVAAAMHAAVLLGAVLTQLYYIRTHPPLKVVSVSLVSLPGAPGPAGGPPASAPSPKPAPETTAPKAPEPQVAPVPKKAEVPVPKKVAEPEVARKTVPAENAKSRKESLDEALAKLRKQADSRPQAASGVGNAIANLQKKVASQGSGPAPIGAGRGGGGGQYGTGGGAVDPYQALLFEILWKKWVPPSSQMLRSTSGMLVTVRIHILSDGSLGGVEYLRKSSSEVMNNSVAVTLTKSIRFPAPPKEYGSRGVTYDINFTPTGISNK